MNFCGRRIFLGIIAPLLLLLSSTQFARADEIYESTLNLCLNHTSFDTTAVDRIVYYLTYFDADPFGRPEKFIEAAHINDYEVFKRNFLAGIESFDFSPDEELRHRIHSPGFVQALNDCLPKSKYPNAEKLKLAFKMELVSQQAVGKIAAGATYFAGGKALGFAAGYLRGMSRRAFVALTTGGAVLGTTTAVVQLIATYIEKNKLDQAFPRYTEAKLHHLSDDEIASGAAEDFKVVYSAAHEGIRASIDESNQELDATIAIFSKKLTEARSETERTSLNQKLLALQVARAR